MYSVFRKSVISKLVCIGVSLIATYSWTLWVSDSHLLSCSALFLVIILWRLAAGFDVGKRRRIIRSLFSHDMLLTDEYPLLEPTTSQSRWTKCIGFTKQVNQPMWVRADKQGVILFYLCIARDKPFLVPWERVMAIRVQQRSFKSVKGLLATLFISRFATEISVPWDHQLNKLVPTTVGFESKSEPE